MIDPIIINVVSLLIGVYVGYKYREFSDELSMTILRTKQDCLIIDNRKLISIAISLSEDLANIRKEIKSNDYADERKASRGQAGTIIK